MALQFYEDTCLLEQKYVLDETRKVGRESMYSPRSQASVNFPVVHQGACQLCRVQGVLC